MGRWRGFRGSLLPVTMGCDEATSMLGENLMQSSVLRRASGLWGGAVWCCLGCW